MQAHEDKPVYHLYDPNGWCNDPNGPLYYKGQYHMFFQNVTDSNKWTWGLSWGHATSTDLLHWRQLPPALSPDPGWHDADGCFSGCATIDTDGVPAILYTGVAKKPDAGEREGMPLTVNKLCYERQLIARPVDPDDPDLKHWTKQPEPFIADHMSGLPVNCFRDPFILEKPNAGNGWRWRVMVGSNIDMAELAAAAAADPKPPPAGVEEALSAAAQEEREQLQRAAAALQAAGWLGSNEGLAGGFTLGTATVYRSKSKDLEDGWEYEGLLCVAKPGEGAIWECPIMAPLSLPAASSTAAAPTAPAYPASPMMPSAPPPSPQGAAAADAVRAASGQLQGAVAAVAEAQKQQQLETERAMSGCLGLWKDSGDASSPAISSRAASDLTSPAQVQQEELQHPTHVFSVSCGVCPAIYWLGRYSEGKFDLETADGPHALDLGDVVYAPNLLEDAQGRQIIWSWLQEHPSPISHDYAGCISLPRQLQLGMKHHSKRTRRSLSTHHHSSLPPGVHSPSSTPKPQHSSKRNLHQLLQQQQQQHESGDQQMQVSPLHHAHGSENINIMTDSDSDVDSEVEYYLIQQPLPELEELRSGRGLRLRGVRLPHGKPWSVPSQVSASHLDLTLTVQPTPGAQRFQLLLGPLRQEGDTLQQQQQQQQGSLPIWTSLDLTDSSALPLAESTSVGGTNAHLKMPGAAPSGAMEAAAAAAPVSWLPVTPATTALGSSAADTAAATHGSASQGRVADLPAAATASMFPEAPISNTTAAMDAIGAAEVAPALPDAGLHDAPAADNDALCASAVTFLPMGDVTAADAAADLQGRSAVVGAVASDPGNASTPLMPSVAAPLTPISTVDMMASAAAAAMSNVSSGLAGAGSSNSLTRRHSPLEDLMTQQIAGNAGAAVSPEAAATAFGSDRGSEDEQIAAMAAAIAAEQIEQEHHQAAAITYEFSTSQVQVLIGPPAAVLKLLKQQQQELAAATAAAKPGTTAAGSTGSTGAGTAVHQSSRTSYPTADALGFEPPVLPPAPTGSLAEHMAAAQAAGVRVLSCQLRELDPDEPLQLRLLLDYSIMELFFGTGEVLTSRVYRGAPTARAKEVALKKATTHATSEALAAEQLEVSSMSGSLANLGLVVQQHQHALFRSGSGRLFGAHSSNCLYPGSPRLANWTGLHGVSGFSSPATGSPRLSGSPRLPPLSVRPAGRQSTESLDSLAGIPDSPSELQQTAQPYTMGGNHSTLVGVPAEPAVPFSPATPATGSYVHYFSPHRNLSARVGGSARHVVSLPTLAGISELPGDFAPGSAAAAAQGVGAAAEVVHGAAVVSEGARIGSAAAGLFGLPFGAAGTTSSSESAAAAAAAADDIGTAGKQGSGWDGGRQYRQRQLFVDVGEEAHSMDHMTRKAAASGTSSANAAQPESPSSSGAAPNAAAAAAAAASSIAAVAAAAGGGSTNGSDSRRSSVDSRQSSTAQDSPSRAGIAIADTFPGFSPHRPPAAPARRKSTEVAATTAGTPEDAGAAAGLVALHDLEGRQESTGSTTTAGAKLASWFNSKLGMKGSRAKVGKGFKDDGSSSKVVVPRTFGVPVAPQLSTEAPAAVAADAPSTAAAATGEKASKQVHVATGSSIELERDPSGVKDQQRQHQQQGSPGEDRVKTVSSSMIAAGLPPKPGLSIKTSSSNSNSSKTPIDDNQDGPAPAAAAAAAKSGSGGSSSSSVAHHQHLQQQQQQLQRRGIAPAALVGVGPDSPPLPSSATTSSAAGSPFAMTRSPRRNWRSAFIFTESDEEEEEQAGPVMDKQQGAGVGMGLSSSSDITMLGAAGHFGVLGGLRSKLAAAQAQLALHEEYGLYSKVFATGLAAGGAAAAGGLGNTAGATAGLAAAVPAGRVSDGGVSDMHASASAGVAAASTGGGSAARVGGVKQLTSGYMPGAMRELSLVALGGGGVVLRLEAYEMASMWDDGRHKVALAEAGREARMLSPE